MVRAGVQVRAVVRVVRPLERINHSNINNRKYPTEGYRRVQKGTEGYRRVQKGTEGCRRVQKGTEGYRRVQKGTEGYRRVQKGAEGWGRSGKGGGEYSCRCHGKRVISAPSKPLKL